MIRIPVSAIEFTDGGNTLWVHDELGGTALRIKITGGISTRSCGVGAEISHCDLVLNGEAHFCLGGNAEKE